MILQIMINLKETMSPKNNSIQKIIQKSKIRIQNKWNLIIFSIFNRKVTIWNFHVITRTSFCILILDFRIIFLYWIIFRWHCVFVHNSLFFKLFILFYSISDNISSLKTFQHIFYIHQIFFYNCFFFFFLNYFLSRDFQLLAVFPF